MNVVQHHGEHWQNSQNGKALPRRRTEVQLKHLYQEQLVG